MANLEDPEVRDRLKAMFPEGPVAAPPKPPTDAPYILLNPEDFRRTIKRCDSGKSGGNSGWTGAHLNIIADDPDCYKGLIALCSDIANGHLDDRARSIC